MDPHLAVVPLSRNYEKGAGSGLPVARSMPCSSAASRVQRIRAAQKEGGELRKTIPSHLLMKTSGALRGSAKGEEKLKSHKLLDRERGTNRWGDVHP